ISAAFNVTGPPAALTFAVQPGGASVGNVWSQQPVVEVRDLNGLPVTGDPNGGVVETVTVVLTPADNTEGATVTGTQTVNIAWANGRATFTDLKLDRTGDYTLTASTNLGGFTALSAS